jgi:multicomponent Na+:H+ antiporter subunit E
MIKCHINVNSVILIIIIYIIILIGFGSFVHLPEGILFLFIPCFISYYFMKWLGILPKRFQLNCYSVLYCFWLINEIIKSSFVTMKFAWSKNLQLMPTMEWIDSEQDTILGLVIYCNSISLTPGTIVLNLKDKKLLVHVLEYKSIIELNTHLIDRKIQQIIYKI